VTDEIITLSHEIRALLEEPVADEREQLLARLEHTLTEGYARALALEAERWRLQRRIGEVAAGLDAAQQEPKARELGVLAQRLAVAQSDLTSLRSLLTTLRDRAREVRVAY
jgi:ABC-type phosphate transport system auxiliary subunit